MRVLLNTPRALVVHGRWQDVVPLLTQGVDVVLTDPPYSEHVQANIRSCNTTGAVKVRKWTCDFEPLTGFEHVPALLTLARRWVLCFCALEQFGDYMLAAGGQRNAKHNKAGCYIRSWVWRKHQAAPQLSGDRPANSCEGIAVMHRPGKMRWNGRGSHAWTNLDKPATFSGAIDNCCEFGRDRNGEKVHEAQKPASLCEHLVCKFSEPREIVFDPFCGSGAIPVAAVLLDRFVVACDEKERWAQHTADRLAAIPGTVIP